MDEGVRFVRALCRPEILTSVGISILIALVAFRKTVHNLFKHTLSAIIGFVLVRVYPIYHEDGKRQIPTIPYEWPNGQGDSGKFLDGIANSELWGKEGGRVYRIWSGMNPEVVLATPDHIKKVFEDSDKHAKAKNNNSGWLMSQMLGECIGLSSHSKWKNLRAVANPTFTHVATKGYISVVQERVQRWFKDLGLGEKRDLDPAGDVKFLPFFITADVMYGPVPSEEDNELKRLAGLKFQLFMQTIIGGMSRYSLSQYLPLSINNVLKDFKTSWRAYNDRAHQRALASSRNDWPVINMYRACKEGTISEEQLYQTLDESLFTNLHVTTGGLSWNIVFLASSPSTQEKVRQEIEANKDTLEKYLLDSTTFLEACISESARLKPVAPFTIPQSAPTDRVVDGYVIPAGTNIIVDTYALNIRNDFWGEDRAEYRPERFFEHKSKDLRYHFWRFGFGSRQCMGKYVTDLMIRAVLVHLLMQYDLSLEGAGKEWQRDTQSWILHPDMKIKCVKRQK